MKTLMGGKMKLLKGLFLTFILLGSMTSVFSKTVSNDLNTTGFWKKAIPKRPPINDDGPGGNGKK